MSPLEVVRMVGVHNLRWHECCLCGHFDIQGVYVKSGCGKHGDGEYAVTIRHGENNFTFDELVIFGVEVATQIASVEGRELPLIRVEGYGGDSAAIVDAVAAQRLPLPS